MSMRALRRAHRRECWRARANADAGYHSKPFRAWLRERARDPRLVGKALHIATRRDS